MKDLARTYLGLSAACTTCHQDQHRGEFQSSCEKCHTTGGWRPADAGGFDHTRARLRQRPAGPEGVGAAREAREEQIACNGPC